MALIRRWLLPVGLYTVLSLALSLPLLRTFTSSIPHDALDPVLNTWILWWSTQRLPLTMAWWNGPMFFPMTGALALSEVLLGLIPLTAPVQWLTHSPLVAYNTAFVVSFPLCALAAYALALEVTGRRDAALLCGVAFAFAPYRMGQLAHLQMLAYYGAPAALVGLHRFVRTGDGRWLVLFAAAWLVQALSNGYALFHFAIVIAFWILWFARPVSRAVTIGVVWAIGSLPLVPVLLRYRAVHTAMHLTRSINEIKSFGVDLADFLTAPSEILLWGNRLWPARPETAVFPGITILAVGVLWIGIHWRNTRGETRKRSLDERVLTWIAAGAALVAVSWFMFGSWQIGPLTVSDFRKPFSIAVAARVLAALRSGWVRRGWRERSPVVFYVIAMVGLYVLALGPEPRLSGRPMLYEPPYAWLLDLPGFDTLRVPARFAMLAVLCQSVLVACAVARWRVRPSSRWSMATTAAIGAALLLDGWVQLPVTPVQASGPRWHDVAAVFELPAGGTEDFGAIYRSTSHGFPIVNGYSGYFPPHYAPLVYALHHGEYGVLHEIAPNARLGVAVDLAAAGAVDVQRALGSVEGVIGDEVSPGWATFTVLPRPESLVSIGSSLSFTVAHANRHSEDIGRLMDGRIDTAWGSGLSQIGDEEVVVDLGADQAIGQVILKMGSFAFGFPRELAVDLSTDGRTWTTVWNGETSVPTVHAALQDPIAVPLAIALGRVSARFLRLRQTGSEPGIPWWIAELEVSAAAPEAIAAR